MKHNIDFFNTKIVDKERNLEKVINLEIIEIKKNYVATETARKDESTSHYKARNPTEYESASVRTHRRFCSALCRPLI